MADFIIFSSFQLILNMDEMYREKYIDAALRSNDLLETHKLYVQHSANSDNLASDVVAGIKARVYRYHSEKQHNMTPREDILDDILFLIQRAEEEERAYHRIRMKKDVANGTRNGDKNTEAVAPIGRKAVTPNGDFSSEDPSPLRKRLPEAFQIKEIEEFAFEKQRKAANKRQKALKSERVVSLSVAQESTAYLQSTHQQVQERGSFDLLDDDFEMSIVLDDPECFMISKEDFLKQSVRSKSQLIHNDTAYQPDSSGSDITLSPIWRRDFYRRARESAEKKSKDVISLETEYQEQKAI